MFGLEEIKSYMIQPYINIIKPGALKGGIAGLEVLANVRSIVNADEKSRLRKNDLADGSTWIERSESNTIKILTGKMIISISGSFASYEEAKQIAENVLGRISVH